MAKRMISVLISGGQRVEQAQDVGQEVFRAGVPRLVDRHVVQVEVEEAHVVGHQHVHALAVEIGVAVGGTLGIDSALVADEHRVALLLEVRVEVAVDFHDLFGGLDEDPGETFAAAWLDAGDDLVAAGIGVAAVGQDLAEDHPGLLPVLGTVAEGEVRVEFLDFAVRAFADENQLLDVLALDRTRRGLEGDLVAAEVDHQVDPQPQRGGHGQLESGAEHADAVGIARSCR